MQPVDLGVRVLELLNTGTFLVQFATLVLLVTQFAKPVISAIYKAVTGNVLILEGDAARYLTLIVQVVIWAFFIFFQARGGEKQFTDSAAMLQGILTALTPLLPAMVITNVAASAGYKILATHKVPGFHENTKVTKAA